jgi:hypothetical protein
VHGVALRWLIGGRQEAADQSTIVPVRPRLEPIDGLRQPSSQLDGLRANRRRNPSAEPDEEPEERDDDQRRSESARNPPARQVIDAARHGQPE